jgi:hypothetical protein
MATETDIEIVEDNDAVILFTCRVDGQAVDLTGASVSFYLKPDKATEENAPTVVHYSTDDGSIELLPQTGATLGQGRVLFVGTDVANPAKKRYRLDATIAERRLTYAFGKVVIQDV